MEKGHIANLRKFTDAIRALPEVIECLSVTGDFDYMLKVMARDLKALSQFLVGTLMALPSVDNVRSSVCLHRIKSTGALPLPG
jgi:DNA-binding Lrp family transcriptional regulator